MSFKCSVHERLHERLPDLDQVAVAERLRAQLRELGVEPEV